jgi:hypothetical protein
MKSNESIALAKIAKILLRKNISKIFLTDNRAIYLSNRYSNEFSLIVEDYSSFYYTDESHPSITILSDGTIYSDILSGNEKTLLNKAKIVYNILVDNLKLKYFWKEIKR